MTAIYNTSSLHSMAGTSCQTCKKGYRSCELNNYKVEVVDFDGVTEEFNVEASSHSEAAEKGDAIHGITHVDLVEGVMDICRKIWLLSIFSALTM